MKDAAFTKATIVRLDPESREVITEREIDLSDALDRNDNSADIPLRWGDIVEYERRFKFDPGVLPRHAKFLTAHMNRKIGLSIPYNPHASDPFKIDEYTPTTAIPARWVTAPDHKTMIPDFAPSHDPEKNELVGALCLSDAIENLTKHFGRKAGAPLSLRRVVTEPSGRSHTFVISNQIPDSASTKALSALPHPHPAPQRGLRPGSHGFGAPHQAEPYRRSPPRRPPASKQVENKLASPPSPLA